MIRVLAVDDEKLILNATCSDIEQNFEVEAYRANSGLEALNMLGKMRFDVVITDISMPLMDGIELTRNVKRLWPQCYVIILTVYDRFEYAYEVMKYERVSYVLKSDNFSALHKALQTAIDGVEEENRKDAFYSQLGKHIELIRPQMQSKILHQLLHQRDSFPEAEELRMAELDLRPEAPVLLAAAALDGSHYSHTVTLLPDISRAVQARLKGQPLKACFCIEDAIIVCFAQPSEGEAKEGMVVYVQNAFEQLLESLEQGGRISLAVTLSDAFVGWNEAPTVFAGLVSNLAKIRNRNALMTCGAADATPVSQHSCLTMDDVNALWTCLCAEDAVRLRQMLSELLCPLNEWSNVADRRPFAERAALSFLYLQLAETFELPVPREESYHRAFEDADSMSGGAWIEAVIGAFAELLQRHKERGLVNSNSLIARIDEFIRQHYDEDIHLSTIAEDFHYSASYLSRLYREYTGETISAGINNARIEAAKKLMRSTNLSVGEISRRCGFYSSKYFMQVFKRVTGMTPTQYRQKTVPLV